MEAGAGVEYDTESGDVTLFMQGSGDLSGDLGIASGSLSGEVKAEAVVSSGQLTELTLSGELEGSGSFDLVDFMNATSGVPIEAPGAPDGALIEQTAGVQGTFSATIDLTDPVVADAAGEYLIAINTGDSVTAATAMQTLFTEAEMSAQLNATESTSGGFDLVVVDFEAGVTEEENMVTWIKPPGGGWHQFQLPED